MFINTKVCYLHFHQFLPTIMAAWVAVILN